MTPIDLSQFEGHDAECAAGCDAENHCPVCVRRYRLHDAAPALLVEVKRLRDENKRVREACDLFEQNSAGAIELEAEVKRLKTVLKNAVGTFGPVTRHGRFSEGGEQRGNRVDCEDALAQMVATLAGGGD